MAGLSFLLVAGWHSLERYTVFLLETVAQTLDAYSQTSQTHVSHVSESLLQGTR